VQIPILTAISGVTWDETWTDRVVTALGTRRVAILRRSTFVKNKRAAGRPKDLADVDAIGSAGSE
jgi:hypothetical protein